MSAEPVTIPDDLAEATAWLQAFRDRRLDGISDCIASAKRARDYADEEITHFLTRDAALRSAEGWDRAADRYRCDVAMMNRILQEIT